ncbi:MAG: ferritin-like domain-containing protein [Roseiflexaceae bacterium]
MSLEQKRNSITRRSFMKGAAGLGGGLAMASFAGAFGLSEVEAAHDRRDDVQTILNLAATAETLAVTFYYSALTAGQFNLSDEDVQYLRLAMDAEKYHLDFLTSAGGRALTQRFYVPANVLTDIDVFVRTGLAAETAFVGAYLAATRRFAELEQPRLAATTAQHAVSEGQHLTLIRDIAGLVPNDLGLPAPVYYNVSDAVPTLAPFLNGGSGFIGPVSYPTAEQYNAALAGEKAVRVPTFTAVF